MISEVFNKNLPILYHLFGEEIVARKLVRLKEIFNSTELAWENNLGRYHQTPIKHILFAEAAPWSEKGKPRYFYNQIESNFHQRIWKAIISTQPIPIDVEQSYLMLASRGFLLLDTIPYAMDFSSKRNKYAYFEIIAQSVNWWKLKLADEKIIFANQVQVAFAFKVNGQKLVEALNGRLKLKNGLTILLNDEMISADGSGYTNSEKLAKIFNQD